VLLKLKNNARTETNDGHGLSQIRRCETFVAAEKKHRTCLFRYDLSSSSARPRVTPPLAAGRLVHDSIELFYYI
jgi:hypothetical protein